MRPQKPAAPEKLGIYVHIPFCRSKCAYCDFYSLAGREDRMDDYLRALLVHLRETAPLTDGASVDSVYFGGGTPSFFGAISLGMQSACPEELADIGRPHTMEQTRAAVEAARKAKLDNLSLDLIYGLPGQTMERWQKNVEAALALEPDHLSCYGLKVEEGTLLAARLQAGEDLRLPDDDAQADMYLWTVERLARAGLEQYEISNFARPGMESRHNLRYWFMRPYIGFGPGAHSDFGGRRYSFVRDLDGYIDGVLGDKPILDDDDLIPQRERGGEYLMLRLRTARGVEEWEYRGAYFMDFGPIQARLQEFAAEGWAERTLEGRWRLTPKGFLLSNQLIGDLLERQEQSTLADLLPRARERFGSRFT